MTTPYIRNGKLTVIEVPEGFEMEAADILGAV